MTPGARVAAAIACLDRIQAGEPAEKVLTTWARASRFAGSGDRRAIRTHVYSALRQRRSAAWVGGDETGRALMIGTLRLAGQEPMVLFTGQGHAPSELSPEEGQERPLVLAPAAIRLDWPDWLWTETENSLGLDMEAVLEGLRQRAAVFLRVNTLKTNVEEAIRRLAADEIMTEPHNLSPTALRITHGEGKLRHARVYVDGEVELQDAASQAVTDRIAAATSPNTILDACAGGGGKSLALAAHFPKADITAHDADPKRMSDLPVRATRAGARIAQTANPTSTFDLVVCDVPCSGSGAWSRSPEGKWQLDADRFSRLQQTQAAILDRFAAHVAPQGTLAYVTCSILQSENYDQIQSFTRRHPGWILRAQHQWTPLDGADGFYLAILTRK